MRELTALPLLLPRPGAADHDHVRPRGRGDPGGHALAAGAREAAGVGVVEEEELGLERKEIFLKFKNKYVPNWKAEIEHFLKERRGRPRKSVKNVTIFW